ALQDYNFKVIHRPGKSHKNVDALTRPPFVAVVTRKKDRSQTVMEKAQKRKEDMKISPEKKEDLKKEEKPASRKKDSDQMCKKEPSEESGKKIENPESSSQEEKSSLDEDSFQRTMLQEYREHLEKDPELLLYFKYLKNKELPQDEKLAAQIVRESIDLILDRGVLYRIISRGKQ